MPSQMNTRVGRRGNRLFVYAALAVFVLQCLFPQVFDSSDSAFAVPSSVDAGERVSQGLRSGSLQGGVAPGYLAGQPEFANLGDAEDRTALRAAAVVSTSTIISRVVNAMGAGAVASVIQAALSAVGEPIVNRVLVKRMKIMEAINDVSPAMMLNFFKTTLATNFLKFPFFEAINAFCACLPLSGSIRGLVTGFVFTSATLPVTNYRYRKSMDLEVNWGNIYEAYLPTVIRDIVYGIARNYCTAWVLGMNSAYTAASPEVLFIVVILGCLISAPFNEWRGFLLQSKGQELTFSEFFKPANFVRSTSLGALKQGVALAVGYWCAPPATKFVHTMFRAVTGK